MSDYKDIKYDFSGENLTALNATQLTSGTTPDARISESSVTQHASTFDDTDLRSDIMTLALKEAITENRVAYNLPNAMIEQFQDDSKIGTETTVDRNASEYVEATTTTYGNHTNTVISGSAARSGTQSKFGSYSGYINDNTSDYITIPSSSGYEYFSSTGDFTVEFFARAGGSGWQNWVQLFTETEAILISYYKNASYGWTFTGNNSTQGTNTGWEIKGGNSGASDISGAWHHIAATKYGNVMTLWYDGASAATTTVSTTMDAVNGSVTWGKAGSGWTSGPAGYIDELRVSNSARYTSSFTPTTGAFSADANTKLLLHFDDTAMNDSSNSIGGVSVPATGTLISTAQTANDDQTKVSGVILYKNEEGTATLGTDLKIYFTCNGGTNWTESTPTAAGTFSSGILMAKCPEVTCTSGTDIRYKAVWANQSEGSKETQLHGIGMNY